ncbi:MAG: hypothetical protein V1794_10705 [Candidatus Glassbacteria bacterium]
MKAAIALFALILLPFSSFAQTVRLEVTADAGLSSERGHSGDNSGRSVTVPVRQNQNWSGFETKAYLFRFDPQPVLGQTVEKAWLNVFLAKGDLYGIGICTVLADWEEGRGVNGQTGRGGASWLWAVEPIDRAKLAAQCWWSWPGSGIYSVSWAHPDLIYRHVEPREIERKEVGEGRLHLRFPVDPRQVAAVANGIAGGLVLTDDKGQVAEGLSLHGEGTPYVYDLSQDIYLFTREIQDPALRPYLEVELGSRDNSPPGALGQIAVAGSDPFDPSVNLTFTAPADDGAAGGPVLGYDVHWGAGPLDESDWARASRLPLWSLPRPVAPAGRQEMRVMGLAPGHYFLAVRAVDEAGNPGPFSQVEITVPHQPQVELTAPGTKLPPAGSSGAMFGDVLELWAVSDLTKVDPLTGGVLQDGDNYEDLPGLRASNPVWSAAESKVSLQAARGEVVAFQLVIGRTGPSKVTGIRVTPTDLQAGGGKIKAGENISCFRVWYQDVQPRPEEQIGPWELVEEKDHRPAWHGDACLPLEPPFDESFDLPTMDNLGPAQKFQAVWIDVFVPPAAGPGIYRGSLSVTADQLASPARIALEVEVLPVDMPQAVSWTVELNGYEYGLTSLMGVDIDRERERFFELERLAHQMAHQHRGTLNILPYAQNGTVQPTAAPPLEGSGSQVRVASWKEWDGRFARYLNGRAFTAGAGYRGPGAGVPLEHMYLPFHENWPLPIEKYYKDWADLRDRGQYTAWARTSRPLEEAFDPEFQQGMVSVARQFFEHFRQQGFTGTSFQTYFNNKYYFKTGFFGMRNEGRGSSFWLLDEPVDYDDYDANRFFLGLVKKGYDLSQPGKVKAHFRTDVSQPEMTRGLWDGICNLWNSSGLFDFASTASYRMKRIPGEKYWSYGGGPGVADKLIRMQTSFFGHWAIGSVGDLPYWDSLRGEGWFRPSDLAVFYPGTNYARSGKNYPGPLAGVRLKVIRRAQQDVEYLNLLAARPGWSREMVRKALARWADDPQAARLSFSGLTVEELFNLRRALVAAVAGR